jgi:tRNA threonylcarbamoyl adenosine modification protein YeaZ
MSRPWLLGLDTSTATVVVVAGGTDGRLLDAESFEGRYRHSQELLPAVVRLTGRAGLSLPELAGVIVGTGPGAFTGLRVGIATAKTLAHELAIPIAGVASSDALLAAVDGADVLWLPFGPHARVAIMAGADPVIVPDGAAGPAGPARPAGPASKPGSVDVAVDLAGRASGAALARGRAAIDGLPAALLRLGAARLAAGQADDPERLVPRYASPPRGAPRSEPEGGVAWSRDRR